MRAARLALAVVAALAALTTVPGSASAESAATVQARASRLDWLAGIPASRLPAPSERPVICLIDSGVAVTPDTPADSPDGPIVARLSVFPEDAGLPSPEDPLGAHGTLLAAAIGAPRNGWGIVGVWPAARIVSIRASQPEGGMLDSSILSGMSECRRWAVANGAQIAAINIAQGSAGSPPQATQELTKYWVSDLRMRGASIVAAAGNTAGGTTIWPASTDGILAVGASNLAGGWCPTATHDWKTVIAAPGCDVTSVQLSTGAEGIWPAAGSSHATALVSATIAALRTLRPDATRDQVEQWVTSTGLPLDDAHLLDGHGLAAAAGLTDLLAYAPADPAVTSDVAPALSDAAAAPPTPAGTARPSPPPIAVMQPNSAPKLRAPSRLRVRGMRRLIVSATGRPTAARLQVAVRSRGRWQQRTTTRSQHLPLLNRRPARIWARWTSPTAASAWTPYARPHSQKAKYWQRDRHPRGPKPQMRHTEEQ